MQKKVIYFILLFFFIVINIYISGFYYLKNQKLKKNISDLKEELEDIAKQPPDLTEVEKEKQFKYFYEQILPTYPEIQSEIDTKLSGISKIYPITLKKGTDSSGWLVEVEKVSDESSKHRTISHYLITPFVQKKLEHSMSSHSGEDAAYCTLDQVITVNNERGYVRELKEKAGYLILASIECVDYGGGDSVAVYSLETGKKIVLNGPNFNITGTSWQGISVTGNALGRLRGVYGLNKPILIVEYGLSELNNIYIHAISAYFDLQTGRLIKTDEFN